ncbi:MAG: glycogen debranching protein [Bacteroidota bacterium]|nr:glycogen debranching protein [Bacteroidota bacterium]
MIWNAGPFSIFKDQVIQDEFFAKAFTREEIISNYKTKYQQQGEEAKPPLTWKLSKDISEHPQYHSEFTLLEALYNMSLEEMEENVEPDKTFRTGAEWVGVWTRDISYSAILSLAMLHPEICRLSLLRKVQNMRIVQDTGTGGAYPVSTDRVVWGIAAWEIFLVTGDKEWLKEAYEILKNSIEDDLVNAYNPASGLYKGESSFLDWREQSYPRWMQPVDIFESESLGTNAVHYQALMTLYNMSNLLYGKKSSEKYYEQAKKLKVSINDKLWIDDKGYYGQYLYGRKYKILSPRAEALGEALCVLYDIADPKRQKVIMEHTPVLDYGIPSIFPQIPNVPSYHNNGIWPFVQAFWTIAAGKVKNETAVMDSLSALYRAAALFLSNKENFVAGTGNDDGTQFNSDRQLWSVAGTLGVFYKVVFGIELAYDKLIFNPLVPEPLKGTHKLLNFKFRKATLNIELVGSGSKIKEFRIDGKLNKKAELGTEMVGLHEIKIILDGLHADNHTINKSKNYFSPDTPEVKFSDKKLQWDPIDEAENYKIFKNGDFVGETNKCEYDISIKGYAEYQVIAIGPEGIESYASEPLAVDLQNAEHIYEFEHQISNATHPYQGFSGAGFIETSKFINPSLKIKIEIEETAKYAIDIRYSNGNGPVNTDNKCAIRTLKKGNEILGTVVMPQRGANEWSNWGFSNALLVHLEEGPHTLELSLDARNENMNSEINEAMLDYMRIIKLV